MVEISISIIAGVFLLLYVYFGHCVEFVAYLEQSLVYFGYAMEAFVGIFAFVPEALFRLLKLPPPESAIWTVAFALAFFHQFRTYPTEFQIKGRRFVATFALITCGLLGAGVSYGFGIMLPKPDPTQTALFIAILYGLLEFVRYTLHAWLRKNRELGDFLAEFKRRNTLYTLPYTVIGITAVALSWWFFGGSQGELPIFATILYVLVGIYVLGLEVYYQRQRKLGRYDGLPFNESTRTQTAVVLLGSCAIAVTTVIAASVKATCGF